jgi:membrane fusion protein, multidrug efflux system
MRKKVFIVLPFFILLAGFIAMKVLVGLKEEIPEKEIKPHSKTVQAAVVRLKDIPAEITAYGRLTSSQPVIMFSEVNGTLMKGNVDFKPAQLFKKGDLLIRVDDRQMHLDINTTKSDLLNALASVLPEIKVDFPEEYEIWQKYFNKCRFDQRISALPEAPNQKIRLYLSRFNVYKLYFTIRNLEIRLDKHFFYAPFNGSIVSTDLRVGSNVRSGTRLGEIINLENMELKIPGPDVDLQWIDYAESVVLSSAETARQWAGSIKRIGKAIDTKTQTVEVFIVFNESGDDTLYDGMFLKAVIPGKIIKRAVSIPRKVLYKEHFVYMIKDGRLDYREVKIARRENNSVIVNGGIQDGDMLVMEIMQGVASGMPAKAKMPEDEEIPG